MLLPYTVPAPGVGVWKSSHKVNGHVQLGTKDLLFLTKMTMKPREILLNEHTLAI